MHPGTFLTPMNPRVAIAKRCFVLGAPVDPAGRARQDGKSLP